MATRAPAAASPLPSGRRRAPAAPRAPASDVVINAAAVPTQSDGRGGRGRQPGGARRDDAGSYGNDNNDTSDGDADGDSGSDGDGSDGGGGDDDGRVEGTEAYLSPELAAGEAAPSVASDAYAFGVTLFQLLAGRLPDADAIARGAGASGGGASGGGASSAGGGHVRFAERDP